MANARSIINAALRKIHVLGVGQTLSAEEAQDALTSLNDMVSSWSVDGALVFAETRESFPLTGGVFQYTIGTGQTFNTARPTEIKAAFVRTSDGLDYDLEQVDQVKYAQIADKDLSGTPYQIYYDANYPSGNIFLWPTPNANDQLHIYSVKPLTEFPDLTTDVSLPEGYRRALIYNLAVEIAPEYEREPLATVVRIADESKGMVKNQNTRNETFEVNIDSGLASRGEFDVLTGNFF